MRVLTPIKRVCAAVTLLLGFTACFASAEAPHTGAPDIVVTLLGTGSPIPEPGRLQPVSARDRMNAMTLVRAGREVLLFDAGRGVVQRLSQAGVDGKDLDRDPSDPFPF